MLLRFLLLVLASVFIVAAANPVHAADPHDDRCVVLISVDGLAGFYLDDPLAEMRIPDILNDNQESSALCSVP